MILKKKAILFLVKYYGYENYICDEFYKKGYQPIVVIENFYTFNLLYRVLLKIFKKNFLKLASRYYKNRISGIEDDIDLVFVMKASMIDETMIKYLKNRFVKAKFIMYQWDEVLDNERIYRVSKFFDKVLTFSINDSKKYGWGYRPLFYIKRINKINKMYDFVFIFSLHTKRLQIYNKLNDLCKRYGCTAYNRLFIHISSYLYRKYIIRDPNFVNLKITSINNKPLMIEKAIEVYSKSRIMIDYSYPFDAGFTMRTIESIGANMKLVTNNVNVVNADFYNPNNIYLYKDTDINIPESFIKSKYQPIDEKIVKNYSIDGWIEEILK